MKQLSNEQRVRLEQIAKDEFNMRRNEMTTNKQKEYSDWAKAECTRMEKSPLFKNYVKAEAELERARKKVYDKGFLIKHVNDQYKTEINSSGAYSVYGTDYALVHPKYKEMNSKTRIDSNAFTRGLNEVLAVIWSMEKPFSECINLIKATVKAIK